MEDNSLFAYLYPCALGLWTLACVAGAILTLRLRPELSQKLDKLPRARFAGALLGFLDLLWCIPNAKPIVPVSLHGLLLPAAIVFAILAWIFLDKLLARAFGGFLILLAHYFLKESFADAMPGAAFFALLCLAFGTFGIFVSGKPHLLRELLRRLCAQRNWRVAIAAFLALAAGASIASLSFHILIGLGA